MSAGWIWRLRDPAMVINDSLAEGRLDVVRVMRTTIKCEIQRRISLYERNPLVWIEDRNPKSPLIQPTNNLDDQDYTGQLSYYLD